MVIIKEKSNEMIRRAQIYCNKFGKFVAHGYISWISKNVAEFEKKTGKKVIANQDEFDDYLEGLEED